jgi:hypothetical protein
LGSREHVAVHVRNSYKKLNVHSRKEVVSKLESLAPSQPEESGGRLPSKASGSSFRIGRAAAQQYVLALDQGSTHSRAVVFDHGGRAVAFAQKK